MKLTTEIFRLAENNEANPAVSYIPLLLCFKLLSEIVVENGLINRLISDDLALFDKIHSTQDLILQISNIVWIDNPLYSQIEKKGFLFDTAVIKSIDFKSSNAADIINQKIANDTHGLIKNLLPSLSRQIECIITSALYFKADWRTRFEPARNFDQKFNGKDADWMIAKDYYPFSETETEIKLAIPLVSNGWFMIIKMSKDGDLKNISEDSSFSIPTTTEYIRLTMPKFTAKAKLNQLDKFFTEKGLSLQFLETKFQVPLVVSDIITEAVVKVDETGIEGSSAAAIILMRSFLVSQVTNVIIDKPFRFVIGREGVDLPIFLGAVTDPKSV